MVGACAPASWRSRRWSARPGRRAPGPPPTGAAAPAIDAARKHTEDPDPSFFGEELGRWEGNTLVIDSIGFKDTQVWADENGSPHSDALHVVERWTRPDADQRFVELCVEILNGFRPVAHLRAFAAPLDYPLMANQLTRRAVRLGLVPPRGTARVRTLGGHPAASPLRTRPDAPGRAGARPDTQPAGPGTAARAAAHDDRVAVLRLRVCMPRAGAVEVAVVLAAGGLTWAMALRLEHRHRRWHCTLMQVL